MLPEPWKDWSPGVLCESQIEELYKSGYIENWIKKDIDGSSFDLHLADEGFELLDGTIKPCGADYRYISVIKNDKLVKEANRDKNGFYHLKSGTSYVFKIQEKLNFKEQDKIYGQATARSSIGRVDVLARLIVDGMDSYEGFTPKCGSGNLFVEIIPTTFDVKVKKGISVSQLRLFYGDPAKSIVNVDKENNFDWLISEKGSCTDFLCVDLRPIKIKGINTSAFCVKDKDRENFNPIDLWKRKGKFKPSPEAYWERLEAEKVDKNYRLVIKEGNFFILRSMERIKLPKGIAVYCRAIDETIGEMRIHYAGFAHPLFGKDRNDGKDGTPLIFEVRGYGVNVNLKHGEKLATLIFYRMSKETRKKQKGYNNQELELSSFFKAWS